MLNRMVKYKLQFCYIYLSPLWLSIHHKLQQPRHKLIPDLSLLAYTARNIPLQ